MKKVWVYGCSFSLLFQDNEDVPAMTLSDSWPNIVASKTGYVLKERSESASGWGTIRGAIERDIIDNVISKDDIMIISPSFFGRSTSPYFEETLHLYAQYGINPDEAACLNVNGFFSRSLIISFFITYKKIRINAITTNNIINPNVIQCNIFSQPLFLFVKRSTSFVPTIEEPKFLISCHV